MGKLEGKGGQMERMERTTRERAGSMGTLEDLYKRKRDDSMEEEGKEGDGSGTGRAMKKAQIATEKGEEGMESLLVTVLREIREAGLL